MALWVGPVLSTGLGVLLGKEDLRSAKLASVTCVTLFSCFPVSHWDPPALDQREHRQNSSTLS